MDIPGGHTLKKADLPSPVLFFLLKNLFRCYIYQTPFKSIDVSWTLKILGRVGANVSWPVIWLRRLFQDLGTVKIGVVRIM